MHSLFFLILLVEEEAVGHKKVIHNAVAFVCLFLFTVNAFSYIPLKRCAFCLKPEVRFLCVRLVCNVRSALINIFPLSCAGLGAGQDPGYGGFPCPAHGVRWAEMLCGCLVSPCMAAVPRGTFLGD